MAVQFDGETRSADRIIRVFISSTFRDMMRERDLLVREVFPELRRKCTQRFVTFVEVDLRWGITEKQANEGQVLPLCLAEIERSRPYFIGLLGERYGWIPDSIAPEVIEREPWLREYVGGRTSVTELEILHGVLNNPTMLTHAFFYFRDPAYVNDQSLSSDERWDKAEHDIPSDVERYGKEEAARRTAERNVKLAALKQRIRDSKLPLVEPYADPKALAKIVHDQIDALIERLYPEDDLPDPLTRERLDQEAFAKQKLFACIDRPEHLAALGAYANQDRDGEGLVVTGESGGGKTALLAGWFHSAMTTNPPDFLFQHYFGATAESASVDGFLRRVLGELKGRFAISDEIPTDPRKLREALSVWLAQTVNRGRVVLVLDGLNQIQGSDPDRNLSWLPRFIPAHVTVIASALSGPALDALRERGWAEHELPQATPGEVAAMVDVYLQIHARSLRDDLREEIVSSPGSPNPLFLRTLLDELRQFGIHERLPQRVYYYATATDPKELFRRVLRRWQDDFDGKDPEQDTLTLNLVGRALTHLWAARQGLSEPEWLDLLGNGSQRLQRAYWTPLFFALEPHLTLRSGLYAFGHDFLRHATEAKFVSTDSLKQDGHLAIADYFERHTAQKEMSPRKAAEWPYQLHAAVAWDRLETCLTDPSLFSALYNDRTKWELTGYWHSLRQRGRDIGMSYIAAYERRREPLDFQVAAAVGGFLIENGTYSVLHEENRTYSAALRILKQAQDGSERALGLEHPYTLAIIHNLVELLLREGDYVNAEALCRRALDVEERQLPPDHWATLSTIYRLASVLRSKGDYAPAEALYRRALAGRESMLGAEHPDTLTSVNGLAVLLADRGDFNGAEVLCRRSLATFERILGPEHPSTLASISNLAILLDRKGDYDGAETLLRRALEAFRHVLGPDNPSTLTIATNLAMVQYHNGVGGDTHAAEDQQGPMSSPRAATTFDEDAGLLLERGRRYYFGDGVEQHYGEARRQFRTASEKGNADAQCMLGNMYDKGKGGPQDYAEALKWYRRAADQGHPVAEFSVAVFYRDGNAVSKDYGVACYWMRQAAEHGYDEAQFNLGVMYLYGHGVTPNVQEALKWWGRAADQGNANAQHNLALIARGR